MTGASMSPDAFAGKWATEAHAMRQRGALVNGAALLDEVLRDFAAVTVRNGNEELNLAQASRESGYSADHLGRLVKGGAIPNAGRSHAPRIRRRDLPRKASALRAAPERGQISGATPEQIARAVVTSKPGEPR